jgi:BMFP domain-containing protein YqiC
MAEYKILDDLQKFGNSTLSAMTTMQRQVRKWVSEQTDALIKGMDLVTREDFQAAMDRIAELEKKLAAKAEKPAPAAAKAATATTASEKPKAKKPAKKSATKAA